MPKIWSWNNNAQCDEYTTYAIAIKNVSMKMANFFYRSIPRRVILQNLEGELRFVYSWPNFVTSLCILCFTAEESSDLGSTLEAKYTNSNLCNNCLLILQLAIFQNWKARWFVLVKNELKYYRTKGVSEVYNIFLKLMNSPTMIVPVQVLNLNSKTINSFCYRIASQ